MLLPKNRPMLKTLGTKLRGNNLKMSLFGILLGFGMNAICVATPTCPLIFWSGLKSSI